MVVPATEEFLIVNGLLCLIPTSEKWAGPKAYPMYWVNCWDRGLYVEREPFQAKFLGSRWNDRSLEEWRNNLELGCSVLSYIVDQRLGNVRLNFITWTAPLQESDNYICFSDSIVSEKIFVCPTLDLDWRKHYVVFKYLSRSYMKWERAWMGAGRFIYSRESGVLIHVSKRTREISDMKHFKGLER